MRFPGLFFLNVVLAHSCEKSYLGTNVVGMIFNSFSGTWNPLPVLAPAPLSAQMAPVRPGGEGQLGQPRGGLWIVPNPADYGPGPAAGQLRQRRRHHRRTTSAWHPDLRGTDIDLSRAVVSFLKVALVCLGGGQNR